MPIGNKNNKPWCDFCTAAYCSISCIKEMTDRFLICRRGIEGRMEFIKYKKKHILHYILPKKGDLDKSPAGILSNEANYLQKNHNKCIIGDGS